MLELLLKLSLPELRRHRLRYALTLLSVLLGVAVFCAVQVASTSLRSALRNTINLIAGETALEITAGEAGVPERILRRVRVVPGVRVAAPMIEETVRAEGVASPLLILGVDLVSDRRLRRYLSAEDLEVDNPLALLRGRGGLILSQQFSRRHELAVGDRLALDTALGRQDFPVRGVLDASGLARAFGGNVGVMSVRVAQRVFSRGRTFDRIDVALTSTADLDAVKSRIEEALGHGYRVSPPRRRGRQTESLIRAFSVGLVLSSTTALLVGTFLIFNAASVSVVERRRQIGILRALGATRGQVRLLFLMESVLVALIASVLGIAAGLLLGRLVLVALATAAERIYGVVVAVEGLVIEPGVIILALVAGTATAVLGGYLPARAAARQHPTEALGQGRLQQLPGAANRRRRIVGVVLIAVALPIGLTGENRPLVVQTLLVVMLLAGLGLLVPTFSHLIATTFARPMKWLFGVEGRLANDSLIQAPKRTAATVSALMLALAFVVSSASFSKSVRTSLLAWAEVVINPDILVLGSRSLTARTLQFPEEMGHELRQVPGVRQVDAVRTISLDDGERSPIVTAIDVEHYLRRATPILVEGDLAELAPRLVSGQGLLISNNLARLRGLGKGDRLPLDTPSGRHELEILGVQVDYTSENGAVFLDRQLYKRLWGDDRVDVFELMLHDGVDPDQVKREVERRFAAHKSLYVLTNQEYRGEVIRLTNQFWLLTSVQLVLAILVAILGITSSLTVSVTERRREIGILRAMGAERRRVRRSFILEALAVGATALVLGIGVGITLGQYLTASIGRSVTGWVFPYSFPGSLVLGLIPATLLCCWLAAWYPASRAARIPLVRALSSD